MAVSYPVPHDESARLDSLRTYRVLDTPPEPELDELCALAAQICEAPIAAVSLVDADRQFFKARLGIDDTHLPRTGESLCTHAIMGREVLQVSDVTADPRFCECELYQRLQIRSYAGAPLVNREDLALGTLCVLDHRVRTFSPAQLRALATLAHQVVTHLELRRLATLGEFRERLTGILSHDLRQPLTSLQLAHQLGVIGPHAPVDATRQLSQMSVSIERLTRLVRDMLDFTQIRGGEGLKVQPRPTNLHALCRAVVQELSFAYPRREMRLELVGDGNGEWDADRLAQAITNMMVNALRYGDQSQPVSLRLATVDEVAIISVHNHGLGIRAEVLPRLFAPFCRGPSDADVSGVGLGLYIVKEIATALGGTVEVESLSGKGTTFTLRLPRRPLTGAGTLRSLARH